jgi:hypothetical protein
LQSIAGNHSSFERMGPTANSQGEFKLENLVPGKYAIFFATAGE